MSNCAIMVELIGKAAAAGANVVHFPECALSGYGPASWPDWNGFDWTTLELAVGTIAATARKNMVWVVTGSVHRKHPNARPTNAQLVFDANGEIVGRYDKRRCSTNDLRAFVPGESQLVLDINGVACGFAICLDWAFPELWRDYAGKVELIFHSCVSDNVSRDRIEAHTVQPLLQSYTWLHHYAISSANSCRPRQNFPSFWIERTGHRGGSALQDQTGFTLNALVDDPEQDAHFEMVRAFRQLASDGSLYAPYLAGHEK